LKEPEKPLSLDGRGVGERVANVAFKLATKTNA